MLPARHGRYGVTGRSNEAGAIQRASEGAAFGASIDGHSALARTVRYPSRREAITPPPGHEPSGINLGINLSEAERSPETSNRSSKQYCSWRRVGHAVYGTEGHRFESCRARREKGCERVRKPANSR